MEHVTFDEFFDFVKNEDANWYIPGLKEYFEGLNQDEIYIQDNFLGKLVFQFNKFENGYCGLYIRLFKKYSFSIDGIKLKQGKRIFIGNIENR